LGYLICQALNLYMIAVFLRVVLSWFPISPGGAMASVYGVLYSVTEPVLGPIRRLLPSVGMIDISPIVIVILVQILCRSISGM
jgi:YggT family protein